MTIPLRCLQVEDSESDAALIIRLLKKAKFKVEGERVESADDLRAALSRQHWDVIIGDFHLPGFDAYKALGILKESGLDIPFIGVSGKVGNEIAAEIMKRGAADYMTKNCLERLVPAIRRELREAEIRRSLRVAEAALTVEKEFFLSMLCSIGEGVITTDAHGIVTLLNPTAEKFTCSTDEAANRPLAEVFQLLVPHTRKPCSNPVTLALQTGERQDSHCPNLLIDRCGVERLVTHSAFPVVDSCRDIIGVVLVFRDVTEEKKNSEALQNSNKLKSIGIVASEIAHDFSNFLSGIWGNIELAQQYCQRNNIKKVMERLSLVHKIFASAKDLNHQLLMLTQGGKPTLKEMSIGPILRQSAMIVLRGSDVLYEMHLPENLWLCNLDENQIGLAFDNIILSARQAAIEGGLISISAENLPEGSPDIPPQIPGNVVRVSIYDPFLTASQISENGMEFSSVHAIMKQHGGFVRVESHIGKGTTFFLYIPAS